MRVTRRTRKKLRERRAERKDLDRWIRARSIDKIGRVRIVRGPDCRYTLWTVGRRGLLVTVSEETHIFLSATLRHAMRLNSAAGPGPQKKRIEQKSAERTENKHATP